VQQTVAQYKLIKKVKDDLLEEEQLHQYALVIQIGPRDLQILVVNENRRALLLEDYVFGEVADPQHHSRIVEDLLDAHPLATAGFWKSVTVSLKHNQFAQVPDSLFVPGKEAAYLAPNASFDESAEEIFSCTAGGIVTVFPVQRTLASYLKNIYRQTQVQWIHQAAALIHGASGLAVSGLPVFLFVDRFKMHLLFHRNGQLIFYNQFPVRQFSDYVKYVMMAMSVLGLDQQRNPLLMWGYIGQKSPHFEEFSRYVKNVSFGPRPRLLSFGYVFDELQEHTYFDLYSSCCFAA
jgi:hypothetical protein